MILVTGATGFLGARVVHRLAGRRVRALVRASSDTRRLRGVEIATGDVNDRASIERALDGASAVVHCAAHYAFGVSRPERTRRTNVEGTRNVLEAARRAGAIAVHVSSVVALGPTEALADESHWSETAPRSVYESTKREAHLVARGMNARIVLPGTIYGPGDRSPASWLHELGGRGLLPVGFRRDVKMSLVHVDDCADAIVRALDSGTDGGEWIAAADVVTFEEWLSAIARAAGKSPPRAWIGERPLAMLSRLAPRKSFLGETLAMSDGASWAFSGDKARRELGWAPRSLERGLQEMFSTKSRRSSWTFDFTR